jgi:hypothetical protein
MSETLYQRHLDRSPWQLQEGDVFTFIENQGWESKLVGYIPPPFGNIKGGIVVGGKRHAPRSDEPYIQFKLSDGTIIKTFQIKGNVNIDRPLKKSLLTNWYQPKPKSETAA